MNDELLKKLSFEDWLRDLQLVIAFTPSEYIMGQTGGVHREYHLQVAIGHSLGGWLATLCCHVSSPVAHMMSACFAICPAYNFLKQKVIYILFSEIICTFPTFTSILQINDFWRSILLIFRRKTSSEAP